MTVTGSERAELFRSLDANAGPLFKRVFGDLRNRRFIYDHDRWLVMLDWIETHLSFAILDEIKAEEPPPGTPEHELWAKGYSEEKGRWMGFARAKQAGAFDSPAEAQLLFAYIKSGEELSEKILGFFKVQEVLNVDGESMIRFLEVP